MSDSPEIRISDADRQVMINRLSTAYAEGRLTEREFEDRISAAGAAKTAAELSVLANDLPAPPPAPTAAVARPSGGLQRRLAGMQFFAVPPIICTAIWLITTPGGYYWPIWVWLGCMVPVLIAALSGDDDDDTPSDGPADGPALGEGDDTDEAS